MKKIPLLLCAALLFCACGSSDRIVFSGTIDAGEPKPLTATVLNDEFEFSYPYDLFIMDSLLVVHDSYQQPRNLHLFRKTDGTHLFSFSAKGRGPGEVLGINSCEACNDGRSVVAYDVNSKKAVVYDVTRSLETGAACFAEYPFRFAGHFIQEAIPYGNRFIVTGYGEEFRFGIADPASGSLCGVYADYLELSDDPEADRSLTAYSPAIRLSPDGKRLVAATYIGGVLEIFEVGDEGFRRAHARAFFKPVFRYVQGTVPRWVTWTEETVLGFQDLALTDEAIYATAPKSNGRKTADFEYMLFKFDYAGTPLACFSADGNLWRFAIDCDGTLYGIELEGTDRWRLVRYDGEIDL